MLLCLTDKKRQINQSINKYSRPIDVKPSLSQPSALRISGAKQISGIARRSSHTAIIRERDDAMPLPRSPLPHSLRGDDNHTTAGCQMPMRRTVLFSEVLLLDRHSIDTTEVSRFPCNELLSGSLPFRLPIRFCTEGIGREQSSDKETWKGGIARECIIMRSAKTGYCRVPQLSRSRPGENPLLSSLRLDWYRAFRYTEGNMLLQSSFTVVTPR